MIQPNFVAGYIADQSEIETPLYLLLRRSQKSHLPGIWQMVTGKLIEGETTSAGVQREILEETGLVCSDLYNVDVTMFYEQSKNHIAFSANFCALVKDPTIVKLCKAEHDAFKWCTLPEACSLLAFPAQKETLAFIHKHYIMQNPHQANLIINKT